MIQAILFALQGASQGKKLASFGTVTSVVDLEYKDIHIERSRAPNRLLLNEGEFEDAAAQSRIYARFGKHLDKTACIDQNPQGAFLNLKPIEKLAFLEKLTLDNTDMASVRDRVNNAISSRTNSFTSLSAQSVVLTEAFNETDKPIGIPFPILTTKRVPVSQPSVQETAINRENEKKETLENEERKVRMALSSLIQESADRQILMDRNEHISSTIDTIDQELNDIQERLIALKLEDPDQLSKKQEELEIITRSREQRALRNRLRELEDEFQQRKESFHKCKLEELTRKKNAIWQDISEEDAKCMLQDARDGIQDLERAAPIRKELLECSATPESVEQEKIKIEQCEKEVEYAKNMMEALQVRKCPKCSTDLLVNLGQLTIHEGDIPDTLMSSREAETLHDNAIVRLRKHERNLMSMEVELRQNKDRQERYDDIMSSFEDPPPSIQECREEEEQLTKYLIAQGILQNEIAECERVLDPDYLPPGCEVICDNIDKITKKIDAFPDDKLGENIDDVHEGDLRELITKLINIKTEIANLEGRRLTISKRREDMLHKNNESRVEYLEKYESIQEPSFLEEAVVEQKKNIDTINRRIEKNRKTLAKIQEWEDDQKTRNYLERAEEKVNEKQIEINRSESQLRAASMLKSKILQAEGLIMSRTISSINAHAQTYLDEFFPDAPMRAELLTTKETAKTQRQQINLQIIYHGATYDRIDDLSGGEAARVTIAFTLALAEIFNNPIVLLDECTANLNEDLVSRVFSSIQKHMGNRLVIVVAHQIVNGIFDKVITFGS